MSSNCLHMVHFENIFKIIIYINHDQKSFQLTWLHRLFLLSSLIYNYTNYRLPTGYYNRWFGKL